MEHVSTSTLLIILVIMVLVSTYNEYGDIHGLVTVEDILEEIVGNFTTSISPNLAEEVIPQSDGSVRRFSDYQRQRQYPRA